MNKIFAVIGYVASVAAAAVGLLWLYNKLVDRAVEEECECDCECDCDCACTEEPAEATADACAE